MTAAPFLQDEESRLLTAEAFDFMFRNELKRAVRSQSYITLLAIDARPVGAGESRQLTREVARLTRGQVRETDLLSHSGDGPLSVVLFDANLQNSLTVVERLLSRFGEYEFTLPAAFSVGAACCPTHGTDVDQLRQAARALQVHPGRDAIGGRPNPTLKQKGAG